MQNKILELAKSYKEELLRKNEMEYATNKPDIGEDFYDHINGIDSVCDDIANCIRYKRYTCPEIEAEMKSYLAQNGCSLLEIADVLGHKQIQMTKRYAHLCVSHKQKLINDIFS